MIDILYGSNTVPVSYTHLDVYKRQAHSCVWMTEAPMSEGVTAEQMSTRQDFSCESWTILAQVAR